MKTLISLCFSLALGAGLMIAQETPETIDSFGAVGASYNRGANPAVAGSAALARRLTTGTYSFTLFDALPNPEAPNTVVSTVSTGILSHVASIRQLDIYVPATAGIAWTGQNTGWSWSSGAVVAVPIKSFFLYPNVRVIRTNVGNGAGDAYGFVVGVMFGGRFGR